MKKSLVLWLTILLVLPTFAATQTSVSGHVITPTNSAPAASKVRFTLTKCSGTPRVTNVGTIVFPRPDQSFEVQPAADGSFSLNLWGNDQITCGKTTGKSRWLVQFFVNNAPVGAAVYEVTGSVFNLDNATPE